MGLMQTWASVEHGYWFARSAEFLQTPVMEVLRWLRVPGDTLFAIGVFALAWFVFRQTMGRPRPEEIAVERPEPLYPAAGPLPKPIARERRI
jgi:nitric oxide reductase subunit B